MKRETGCKIITLFLLTVLFHVSVTGASENNKALQQTVPLDSLERIMNSPKIPTPKQAFLYIRGVERVFKPGFHPMQAMGDVLLFLPRQAMYGIRYASGYGTKLMSDPKFTDRIEDFFASDDKFFHWYPIIDLTSDYRPKIGSNFLLFPQPFELLFSWNYAGSQKFELSGDISYRFRRKPRIWRITLSALYEYDDDRQFHGIGVNPRLDPRNSIRPCAEYEYGVYKQKRWKIQLISGVRLFSNLELFYTGFLQKRVLYDAKNKDAALSRFMELNALYAFKQPVHQFYNELSLRIDTRKRELYLSQGLKLDVYYGRSKGINRDASRFSRYGVDVLFNFAVLQNNRLLTPRLVFDRVINDRANVPLPFTEYPQQPTFRGVSGRQLLRTDECSFVPSLEYHWPLSFNLGAHLFVDVLMVSDTASRLSCTHAPWAVGIGADFHAVNEELARGYRAAGSEGIRLTLNVGLDPLVNSRSNWE